jgi:hypothetical protein
LLRVSPADLNHPALIDAIVDAVEVPRDRVDFMLDYRHHAMDLSGDLVRIPHIDDWRLLISASGVFPKTLTGYQPNSWHQIPRNDWTSWQTGITAAGTGRKPVYSDYTTRPPGPPADFGDPSVNVRYTTDSTWLFQIGGKFKEGAAPEMHELCRRLVARAEFRGPDFSAGDEAFDRVTDDHEGPGAPTQWVQWAASHHIEFAFEQVSAAAV